MQLQGLSSTFTHVGMLAIGLSDMSTKLHWKCAPSHIGRLGAHMNVCSEETILALLLAPRKRMYKCCYPFIICNLCMFMVWAKYVS